MSVSLTDYLELTENVEKINVLLQRIIKGETFLFKYMLEGGTTITVDSKYSGVLISSPDRCSAKHSEIFLQCPEWNKLTRLDLIRKIPKLYMMTNYHAHGLLDREKITKYVR